MNSLYNILSLFVVAFTGLAVAFVIVVIIRIAILFTNDIFRKVRPAHNTYYTCTRMPKNPKKGDAWSLAGDLYIFDGKCWQLKVGNVPDRRNEILIAQLRNVWLNKGVAPIYHDTQKRELQIKWPLLCNAIEALINKGNKL